MRDVARIDRMIDLLRKLWHLRHQQRLGQLVLVTVAEGETRDLWDVEDDDAEESLRRALEAELEPRPEQDTSSGTEADGGVIDLTVERARRGEQ